MQYIQASLSYSPYVPRSFPHAYLCDIQVSQVFKRVGADFDFLVDLLESIDHFLKHLDIYTKVPPTPAMTEIIVKIMVELLSTIAVVTKQNKQGRPSEYIFAGLLHNSTQCISEKFVKKLFGEYDVEVVLQRLDRLTQEEAWTTAAQTLAVVYGLVQNMRVVLDGKRIYLACQPLVVEHSFL